MKKRFHSMKYKVALSMLMLLLAFGCSKKAASEGAEAEASEGEISGNLSFATWDSNQSPGMLANIDLFVQANPDVSVALEVTPWTEYWQKLRTAASSNNLPDLFWMHVIQFDLFASSDALMDLTDRIDSDPDVSLSNYPADLSKLFQYQDRQYAIPKDFDTIGLWYNKTLFDEAGVEYPNENWTWDDLVTAGKALTNEAEGIYGFLANNNEQEGWWNYIYQNGGAVVRPDGRSGFDMPETIEAVQRYVDFILKDGIAPPIAEADDQQFFSGKIAMRQMGSWMVSSMNSNEYANANLDLAMLPTGPKTRATIYNGLGYAISAESKNPEAAWAFEKVLASEAGHRLQAEKGAAIPAFNNTLAPWANSFGSGFNLKAYPDQLQYAIGYPQAPGGAEWSPLMVETMGRLLSGEIGVEEGLTELAAKMNEIIDENK
ncbi:sugar ABC transporter substrate-binding protein [Candidatus Haliotispira prima]|uniref:sn-glycerol-3-phosphate-binding periplasmic protein UgpB n=1 Tax=Candidatus Haliotispira prima TaxID=3034016 RepID=A0ABY8MH98_9SPIO|nr:sugar ABC transporter substrate-binding protein [Candidatus Haliotispira prima]